MSSRRKLVHDAHRIVIKIGSSSLTRADGGLDLNRLDYVAGYVAELVEKGKQVVVVSSGAIAAAMGPLGLQGRPRTLAMAQACAALGQGLLMTRWYEAFQTHRLQAAQVLLTVEDVMRRQHYTNAQTALVKLLNLGVIPVVNENDAVATHEIRFGDNDRLAALCAQLVKADALIMLTDVDGLYDRPPKEEGARKMDVVDNIDDLDIEVTSHGSDVGTGGMVTKLQAARIAHSAGIPTVVTHADLLGDVLKDKQVGTLFVSATKRRPSRELWLAHAAEVAGAVVIDAGAYRAITDGKSSLLAAGVDRVDGDFSAGDVISIATVDGEVGRGIVGYSAFELRPLAGLSSDDIRRSGIDHVRPVIHRDDLALNATCKKP